MTTTRTIRDNAKGTAAPEAFGSMIGQVCFVLYLPIVWGLLSELAEWRNGSASDSSMWNAKLPQWSLQKVIRSNRVSVIYFLFSSFFSTDRSSATS